MACALRRRPVSLLLTVLVASRERVPCMCSATPLRGWPASITWTERRAEPGRAATDHDHVHQPRRACSAAVVVAVAHGMRPQATKMGMSTVTPTEVDVMFQAVPR